MSSDQKPGRIKIISSGTARTGPGTSAGAASVPVEGADALAKPTGLGWLASVLFLAGCALGGVGLIAWPHVAG